MQNQSQFRDGQLVRGASGGHTADTPTSPCSRIELGLRTRRVEADEMNGTDRTWSYPCYFYISIREPTDKPVIDSP